MGYKNQITKSISSKNGRKHKNSFIPDSCIGMLCILVSVQLNLTHTSSSDDIRSLHQELNTLRRDYNNVLSDLANIRKSLGT